MYKARGQKEGRASSSFNNNRKGGRDEGGRGKAREKLFFQRQGAGSSMCRLHALNNALGRAALNVRQFEAAADAFDKLYGLSGSRTYFLVADVRHDRRSAEQEGQGSSHAQEDRDQTNEEVSPIADRSIPDLSAGADDKAEVPRESESEREDENERTKVEVQERREDEEVEDEADESEESGEEKDGKELIDLMSYILRHTFKYRTRYIPLNTTVDRFEREELDQCCAFLSFSESHVWAYRRVGNTWYCLDSLQPRPTTIKPKKALASGLGHILVYSKTESDNYGGKRERKKAKPARITQRADRVSIVQKDEPPHQDEHDEKPVPVIEADRSTEDSSEEDEDAEDEPNTTHQINRFECLGSGED